MDLRKVLINLQGQFLAYAREMCRHADDAEDLVQTAMMKALNTDRLPKTEGEVKPWFFRIMRNLHIDDVRKKNVRTEYLRDQIRLYNIEETNRSDMTRSLMVRQAFDRLDEDKREILFLVDVAGMKYAEIAEVMDIPIGTVMSRVSRARRELLDILDSGN
ncbi:RNA polymerase sigma factor [Terasakiella sp. A23]|uniref:RNA polymerase sigma factor n=1 Tax=Terasakiella sp. FCG-A23 TaxID=3080561 RepID=UPI0029554EBF|nr:RNA polymerase sigma factor [Terasakiella sp. A23]MDV7339223.1 RNA polymerase sigma factor [Terasakiella sp. A23]